MDKPRDRRLEKAWLRLRHLTDIPGRAALELVRRLGSPAAVFDACDQTLQAALESKSIHRRTLEGCCDQGVGRDLRWLRAGEDRHIVGFNDDDFPPLLRELPDPPLLLYVKGRPGLLSATQLAIVGSRNPTPAGRELAHRFARSLSTAGLTVTSGLATGIDGAAHKGALAGAGETVAVTATGLDRVYPARHRDLAREIGCRGAMVSEFPIGTPPRKLAFPRRNRIISGLCVGTLVVEAARRSGSLITARLAGEQGREVFAVPGPVSSPTSRGCHALLKDGARLVETEADIFEELGYAAPDPAAPTAGPGADVKTSPLMACMGRDPVTINTLVQRSGLTADTVSSMILRMELMGVVKSMAGGHYIRVD